MRAAAWLLVFAFLAFSSVRFSEADSAHTGAAADMERKLQHIRSNGQLSRPDPAPTRFAEQEVNAYFASGHILLPRGVKSVRFEGEAGVVTASSRVDFEQIKAGQDSGNPLLSVFSGIHDVAIVAHANAAGGQATVHVDTVSIDDVEIPRFVLKLFVENYLQPKYPNVGLDSRFPLPDRIDTATVGSHLLTITQK